MYRTLVLIGCLLLAGLSFTPTATAQQTVTYSGYLQLVAHLQTRAEAARSQPAATCRQTLEQIAATLAGVTQVQMPDGTIMRVQHEDILAGLRHSPCDPAPALNYLAGICPRYTCPADGSSPPVLPSEMFPLAPGGSVPPAPADSLSDAAADAVGTMTGDSLPETAEDNFPDATDGPAADTAPNAETENVPTQPAEPDGDGVPAETAADNDSSGPDGVEVPVEAVPPADGPGAADGETNTAGSTTGNGPTEEEDDTAVSLPTGDQETGDDATTAAPQPDSAPYPAWLIWLGLLALVMIAGATIWLWQTDSEVKKGPARKKQATTPATALKEGRQLVEQGDYRRAVRQLFLAVLLLLEERGVAPHDRALTNYELLYEIEKRSPLAVALAPIVATFERVWYGFEPLARADYDRLVEQIEQIKGEG